MLIYFKVDDHQSTFSIERWRLHDDNLVYINTITISTSIYHCSSDVPSNSKTPLPPCGVDYCRKPIILPLTSNAEKNVRLNPQLINRKLSRL